MQFTSLHFFLFFAVIIAGLLVLRQHEHKILWLLLGGMIFYGYFDWRFLALIGFTSIFDFWMGLKIGAAPEPLRKRLVTLDIIVNLGILCIFKYLNFFIESVNSIGGSTGVHWQPLNILLPIGISFFVFEAMSYCIDVYRGKLEPYTNWKHFALFIFFFPRMIAGPIIRPADFLPQIERAIVLTWPNFIIGGQLFLFGMTKKLVIADRLSTVVDPVFANPQVYSTFSIWQAVIAYSIQIFCDFSGYSDMAIGLAKILGFDLPVNFRMPYLANNVTDFWRRWHISLSSWLRDYLYISLGGNRKGTFRTYGNLLITMTLGGLWHGASWNFVIWGVLHGLGLAIHKAYTSVLQELLSAETYARLQKSAFVRALSWAITYLFVCFGWVFFRAQHFDDAWLIVRRMSGMGNDGLSWISGPLLIIFPVVIAAHAVGAMWEKRRQIWVLQPHRFSHQVALFMWVFGIFFLAATVSAPFIYFQF